MEVVAVHALVKEDLEWEEQVVSGVECVGMMGDVSVSIHQKPT